MAIIDVFEAPSRTRVLDGQLVLEFVLSLGGARLFPAISVGTLPNSQLALMNRIINVEDNGYWEYKIALFRTSLILYAA